MHGAQNKINWHETEKHLGDNGQFFAINSTPITPSTQILAKDAARSGAQSGSVFVTDWQSSGRGRRDRQWQSLPGQDLTFSLLLRMDMPTANAAMLNIAASIAVCRVIRALSPDRAERTAIKWPNDVLTGGRKVCGIICESAGSTEKLEYAVLGIGINVNGEQEELPGRDSPDRPAPASLRTELGYELCLPELLALVLKELALTCPLTASEAGRGELISIYKPLCCSLGESVRIITDDGEFRGTAADITESGAIVIDIEGVKMIFDVGDVVHARIIID